MIDSLILELFDKQMIKFGDFTLKSGKKSHIYADIRTCVSYPDLFKQICNCYSQMMKGLNYDLICGVPYSGMAFSIAVAYEEHKPLLLKRKEAKDYGTKKILEGVYQPNQTCLLIEDVVTTGASLLETIEVLEQQQIVVKDICTLIDRNQGGAKLFKDRGYKFHSVMSLIKIIEVLVSNNRITKDQADLALSLVEEK